MHSELVKAAMGSMSLNQDSGAADHIKIVPTLHCEELAS